MTEASDGERSRREFLCSALRYAALGALAAGGAFMLSKRRPARDAYRCTEDGNCSACAASESCPIRENE